MYGLTNIPTIINGLLYARGSNGIGDKPAHSVQECVGNLVTLRHG